MSWHTLTVERTDDGVVTLTLNRPEKKNAINGPMWRELIEVFDEVADTVTDRVLVITGAGDGFCSGADLTDTDNSGDFTGGVGAAYRRMRVVGRAALRLHELAKPTIAAVNGVAAGAGCNLALGCDLVVASDRARFTEIFSKRGLSVDFGGSWLLPRLVGLHKAKELVFLADILDADEAERVGIVNRVVPHDELEKAVGELAARLAALPPVQLGLSKRLLNQSLSVSMSEALEFEDTAQTMNFSSRDTAEAMAAFVQKRDPNFTGE
jgi:enoyl-CoA hydratase/carnithine racemase